MAPVKHLLVLLLPCLTGATALRVAKPEDPWEFLRYQLKAWPYTEDFAVEVGNATHGRVFLYEQGTMTLDRKVQTASTSKWPMASMVTAVVADGVISSLDDKPSKYLPWWTTDPKDLRSEVTLRMLLSFTSGFGGGSPGEKLTVESTIAEGPPCMSDIHGDYMSCAKDIYNQVKLEAKPGTLFSYNSFHLQLAGAMAAAAANLTAVELVDKYLYKTFGMNSTDCMGGASNPPLAVCLRTTGADYGSFLARILDHTAIPASLTREMEKDYTTPPVQPAGLTLFGDYCFGHFYECFDSNFGMTDACREANVHADPGAFGYYPLIDRKNQYYMQVVVEEKGKFYNRSGIPEYLRVVVKPYVDLIMNGEEAASGDRSVLGKLTLEDANYIQACYNNDPSCLYL